MRMRRALGRARLYAARVWRVIQGRDLLVFPDTDGLLERHGSEYGGWVICRQTLNRKSCVYSVGIGEDVSFDLSLIHSYGVEVYGFDPTPRSIAWVAGQALPAGFHFLPYGLAAVDGVRRFYAPVERQHVSYSMVEGARGVSGESTEAEVRSLRSLMAMTGHERIDLLKMDIEGAEYDVIEALVSQEMPIRQLLVEFHHSTVQDGVERTRRALWLLRRAGYLLYAVSTSGREFSFIYGGAGASVTGEDAEVV